MELASKGYSRCFVEKREDIAVVKAVLLRTDKEEVEGYMLEDWITVAKPGTDLQQNVWLLKEHLVYNGKFRIDVVPFVFECGRRGVGVIVRSCTQTEYQDENY